MPVKLNSMRLLENHGIPYDVIEYLDTMRDAEEIARVLGTPAFMVYKTLVVQPVDGGKPALVMLAADRSLDLKQMAKAMRIKKVSMVSHSEAEHLTGLKVGGISALALTHKHWPVYLDQPAAELDHILISAGQRGLDLRVPTTALIRLLDASVADVGHSS